MPKHIRPETVAQFFELHDIPTSDKPSFWRKAIAPALKLGFRIGETDKDKIVVITPERRRKIYRGFGEERHQLGMILMHSMFSNRLH